MSTIEEIENYIAKAEMGVKVEPLTLELLKNWAEGLHELEEKEDEISDLEIERDQLEDEIDALDEEKNKWETLATEALEDAGEWKMKCRELEKKLSDIELDQWRERQKRK